MPTYVYKCTQCGHEFEIFQKATDEPIRECEECKGEVRKVFFPVGIVFKGSGFHINDYRRPDKGNGHETKDSTSTSESKPATPPAEKATSNT